MDDALNDHEALAQQVLSTARELGLKIACAESCTGGVISAALTSVPGSSDVFDRGFATYSNAAKVQMLGVDPDAIETHGAVSEVVARQMATGALAQSDADLTISVTGVAGPGGTPAKPEGMVCFGVARIGYDTQTETIQFGPLGRGNVRSQTVKKALLLLLDALPR